MNKILMSIKPQWCSKIFDGEKMIELRKTRPNISPPFEVLVYRTKQKRGSKIINEVLDSVYGGGKVIGSFVCDKAEEIMVKADCVITMGEYWKLLKIAKEACLSKQELKDYIGVGGNGYGWHITKPKLYDKPRELSEFGVTRAPMSWCRVEDKKEVGKYGT